MTPHGWSTTFFLVLLGGLFLTDLWWVGVPLWTYFLLLAIYLFVAVQGSIRIGSGYHLKALCHGSRDKAKVHLSFDDGPDPLVTPQVLDLLKENGVKASFFLIGKKVEAHPELVKRIREEGHMLGNHSWSHSFFFDLYSSTRMYRELEDASLAIERVTGERPYCFRPPYGVSNPMLRKAVKRSGLRVIGWDLRTFDTSRTPGKVMERVERKLRPGSIVLLHDTHPDLVRILPGILALLSEKGLEPADPHELLQN